MGIAPVPSKIEVVDMQIRFVNMFRPNFVIYKCCSK